jgi:hypothetical protein
MKIQEMEQGKIYFISYGGTEIVGRFRDSDTCNHNFYDYLHYWNGYERFQHSGNEYCVKSGIQEIRRASKPEKQALIRFEIEHETI